MRANRLGITAAAIIAMVIFTRPAPAQFYRHGSNNGPAAGVPSNQAIPPVGGMPWPSNTGQTANHTNGNPGGAVVQPPSGQNQGRNYPNQGGSVAGQGSGAQSPNYGQNMNRNNPNQNGVAAGGQGSANQTPNAGQTYGRTYPNQNGSNAGQGSGYQMPNAGQSYVPNRNYNGGQEYDHAPYPGNGMGRNYAAPAYGYRSGPGYYRSDRDRYDDRDQWLARRRAWREREWRERQWRNGYEPGYYSPYWR